MRYCSVASLLFITTLGWACNVLALEPGQHVGVTLKWPLVINGGPEENTTHLNFDVDGCDDFALQALRRRGNGDWKSAPASFERMARGRYVAHLGPEQVVGADAELCFADADRPYEGELQLRITCAGDGREAQSQGIPVHFVPAEKSRYVPPGLLRFVPLEEPGRVMAFGMHWMGLYDPNARAWFSPFDATFGAWILDYSTVDGSTFKADGNVGYAGAICDLPSCGTMPLPDGQGETDVSYLYTLNLETPEETNQSFPASRFPLVKDFAAVPGFPQLLHADDEGVVVVAYVRGKTPGTYVYRLQGKTIVPMHFWPGEWVHTGAASETPDDLLFLTQKVDHNGFTGHVALRSIYSDTAVSAPASPSASEMAVYVLSPDGLHWILDTGEDVYLGSPGQAWSRMFTRPRGAVTGVGFAGLLQYEWSERSVFVIDRFGKGHVDVYSRDDHTLLGSYDANANVVAGMLRDGTLALQSQEAIVLLGSDGAVHGKINLPHCGDALPYARPVELTGGTLAATVTVQGMARTFFFPIPRD